MTRTFSLFSLLHPRALDVQCVGERRLHYTQAGRESVLERDSVLRIGLESPETTIAGDENASAWMVLSVPELRREFFGALRVWRGSESLHIVLSTDIETATGCIVGAELPVARAGMQALAAQAVVSRSILIGTPTARHAIADFCDTTHCQYFRSPALPGTAVATAVRNTHGLVLRQNGLVAPARYTGACGGTTETGYDQGFRYESVACKGCRERGLARRGHGWGLCQEGAMTLAAQAWHHADILRHYLPSLTISN